jgi:hypothetical protein
MGIVASQTPQITEPFMIENGLPTETKRRSNFPALKTGFSTSLNSASAVAPQFARYLLSILFFSCHF